MTEKKSRKLVSIIFWLLTAAAMVIIFYFSSCPGDDSQEQSSALLRMISSLFGNTVSENTLRKTAHFTEYAVLGTLLYNAIYFTFGKDGFVTPFALCAAYAASDEIHQYFVPGRACRLLDVIIDSSGAALGVLICLLIIRSIKNHTKRY